MKNVKSFRTLLFGIMTIFFLSSFTSSEPKKSNPVMEAMGWFWGIKCENVDSSDSISGNREIECCKRRFGIKFGCEIRELPEYQN